MAISDKGFSASGGDGAARSLLCRSGSRLCAVALGHVIETMRPLPEKALADMPPFVRGVALIRGAPTPVLDVRRLLGILEPGEPERFVTLRTGDRAVALAFDEVIGVRDLASAALAGLPPLLSEAGADAVAAIGRLDAELLVVLRGAWRLPEAVWQALDASGGGR
jgi:purine-binding chemotaxis protein CheW